ncbi:MAG: RNA polymerase sigma-70 factor [Bacteroidetes bacterium]|nr:RNA polymerase sigma-70 factor [Bacteroidota bacterium]
MASGKSISNKHNQQGDLEAFETLFNKHYSGLLRYGSQLTGNEESSREIIQEVFMRLWENRERKPIDNSLKSYLFSAVHNRSLNYLRHQKIEQNHQSAIWLEWLGAPLQIPEINPFLKKALITAIDSLPQRAKECFSYTQLDGLSYQETAELMEIKVKTVENQVNRARKLLQKKLRHFI